MKLTTYNIQYGFGSDGLYDLRRIAETCVAVPEIAALVDAEDRYITATQELRQQVKHWLIARQEIDVAEEAGNAAQ